MSDEKRMHTALSKFAKSFGIVETGNLLARFRNSFRD
jgi:hypothetical protein